MKKIFLYILLMVITVAVFGQNVYVVTKTTDPNPFTDPYRFNDAECDPDMLGTLQWAINKSNDDNAESVIEFNIPGTGPHEINLIYYLPQIKHDLTIDGESQSGYIVGSPMVIINGANKVQSGFDVYGCKAIIKGLSIINFAYQGIQLTVADESEIVNNMISNIYNFSKTIPGIGIKLTGCFFVEIYGNTIQTDLDQVETSTPKYGIYVEKSESCTIGGINVGEGNTISECGSAGIVIYSNKFIKMSGNRIFNNARAIVLYNEANEDIQPPIISEYNNGILSGTALPNSTVEVFGSIGEENANEYLVSVVADGNGDWSLEVSTVYEYFAVTQMDLNNNTSVLIEKFAKEICDYYYWTHLVPSNSGSPLTAYNWINNVPDLRCCSGEPCLNEEGCFWITDQSELGLINDYTTEPIHSNLQIRCSICVNDNTLLYLHSTLNPNVQNEEWYFTSNGINYTPDPLVISFNATEAGIGEHTITFCTICDLNSSMTQYLCHTAIITVYGPDATINPAGPFCENDPAIILSAADSGGEWTIDGVVSPDGHFNPADAGSGAHTIHYYVEVDGCSDEDEITIIVNEMPSPEAIGDEVCAGESATIFTPLVTNETYNWSGPGDFNDYGNTITLNNVQLNMAGLYSVIVTNTETGCTATSSAFLIVNPTPIVNISPDPAVICNNAPITLDAGIWPWNYTILWSTGENTQTIIGDIQNQIYSVTVTSDLGCTGLDEVTTVPDNITIKNPIVTGTCDGSNTGSISFLIAGGQVPYEIQWTSTNGFSLNQTNITNPNYSLTNLFSGVYTVTITDELGCEIVEEFEEVEDFPIPILEIETENSCNNDNTGSAEVIVTNIPGSLSYIWSNGETDDEINNQYPGQYFVTVTDNTTGCSAEAVANIESYSVDAHFDWAPECLNLTSIQNNGMYYYPTSVDWDNYEDYEYYWELGNETIGADFLIILDYEYEGFYCPSLTMTQGNCTDTYQEQVYVYPSNCYCTAVEDDYDPNVYYAWYWEIDAGTTEQWDNRQVWINDRLVIEDGATLTLKQCTIHMGPKGRIIVEPKATLNSVASVFTSWELGPECDHMWQGIEVHGQGPYSPNPHIGSVNFYGSPEEPSIVKNAHIAALLGERNMDYTCMVESFTGALPFYIKGYDGKMVVGNQNVTFENNGIDVKMVQTMFYPYNNDSKITNCQFICNAPLLDPAYHINHPNRYGFGFSPFGYPNQVNPRNPWAGPANPYQRTVAGIWSHKQNFKVVKNCDFRNMQTGIESYQSRYDVADCDFTFMITGINIMNYDAYASSSHRITLNTFDNIPGINSETGNHIKITNGMYDKIRENTFGSGNPMSINGTGVYTNGASKFLITENNFNILREGVKVTNSGIGGGEVRADFAASHDDWRGNVFRNCNTNMLADAYNPKLRLRCNMCYNNTSSVTPINIDNTGFLANQGYTPPPMNITVPHQTQYGAGNEFLGSVPNPKRVDSDNTYYYYHHSSPSQTIPNPNDVYTVLGSVHYPKFTNAQSCPLLVPDIWFLPPGFDSQVFITLDSLYNAVEVIKTELTEMKESLDNGQTQELLNAIYSNMANGRLKNLLIENSPLSDTVLTALFIEYPLSHGNFKNVMLLNLPVSSSVEPFFFERISTIPSGTANILLPLQSYNPGVVTPAFLNRKLDETILEKQLYLNNLVSILTDTVNNREQDAISLLLADNSVDSYIVIAGDYTMSGNYVDAQIIIDQLASQYPELSDWVAYKELLLSLYQSGKTVFDMNLEEYNFVKDLAYQCPHGSATAAAQSILYLISGETVPECELMNTRSKPQLVKPVDFIIPDTDAYITENYPDPFTSVTYVDYFIPEGSNGTIVLNDMYGRKIKEYEVFEGENVLTISKDNLTPGVYTYGLIVDNKLVEFKKLVITQ